MDKGNEISFSTYKSLFWVGIEKFGYGLVSFASVFLLARILSPYEFGLVGTISIFIAIPNMIVESGFGAALVNKKDVSKEDYSTVFIFNLVVSLFFLLLFQFFSGFIGEFYHNEVLSKIVKVLSLLLVFNAVTLTQRIHLIRELKFKVQARISIFCLLISVSIGFTLALMNFGVWALVGQQLSYSFFYSVIVFFTVKFVPKLYFSVTSFKSLFGFGGRVFLAAALQTIYYNAFELLISKYYGVRKTGLYTNSKKVIDFPNNILKSLFDFAVFPTLSRNENDKEFKLNASRLNSTIYLISLPFLLFIPFNSEIIVNVLLGDKWNEASAILALLSIGSVFLLLETASLNLLKSLGKGGDLLNFTFLKIFIGVISLFLGIYVSMDALLWGITITYFISSIAVSWKAGKMSSYSFRHILLDFAKPLCIALLSNIIINFIDLTSIGNWGLLVNLLIVILLYILIYAILFRNKSSMFFNSIKLQFKKRTK